MKPIPDDPTFVERFTAYIDTSGGVDACWPIGLAPGEDGYATWTWTGPDGERLKYRAHRLALTLAQPPPSESLYALHGCDNRMCCNPTPNTGHLYWGTAADNAADRDRPWRRCQLRNQRTMATGQLGLFTATPAMFDETDNTSAG